MRRIICAYGRWWLGRRMVARHHSLPASLLLRAPQCAKKRNVGRGVALVRPSGIDVRIGRGRRRDKPTTSFNGLYVVQRCGDVLSVLLFIIGDGANNVWIQAAKSTKTQRRYVCATANASSSASSRHLRTSITSRHRASAAASATANARARFFAPLRTRRASRWALRRTRMRHVSQHLLAYNARARSLLCRRRRRAIWLFFFCMLPRTRRAAAPRLAARRLHGGAGVRQAFIVERLPERRWTNSSCGIATGLQQSP